jgi:hypothetical protein
MIRTGRPISETSPGQLHELSIADATEAIRDGSITSIAYATALLRRHRDHANGRECSCSGGSTRMTSRKRDTSG